MEEWLKDQIQNCENRISGIEYRKSYGEYTEHDRASFLSHYYQKLAFEMTLQKFYDMSGKFK